MRKYLILLCVFVLVCGTIAYARMSLTVIAGENAGGGGQCTVENDSAIFDYTAESFTDLAGAAGSDWGPLVSGIQFVTAGSYTITQYQINVATVIAGGSISTSIYTDSAGSIGSLVDAQTTKVETVSGTGIATFTLASPYLLTSGTYWIRFSADVTPFIQIQYKATENTHRISVPDYYDNGAMEVALFGCAE